MSLNRARCVLDGRLSGLALAALIVMRSFGLFFSLILATSGVFAGPRNPKDLVRCQVTNGYELALQREGRSHFLALYSGDHLANRMRLTRPYQLKIRRSPRFISFQMKKPNADSYVVKIEAEFDGESSFNEFVHYKMPPRPNDEMQQLVYEVAGQGLPIRDGSCWRP